MRRLAFLFVALIVYGSLYPFSDWRAGPGGPFDFLRAVPEHVGKADAVQNILAYLPLGAFLGAWLLGILGPARSPLYALLASTLAGALLSLAMESLQHYLPSRDPSLSDLILNIGGTLGGAVLASFLRGHIGAGARLRLIRHAWIRSGTLPNLGMAALALWALAQTSPLVPSLDVGQLRAGVAQLAWTMLHPSALNPTGALLYGLHIAALGMLAHQLARPERPALRMFGVLVAAVLLLKIVLLGRQLSGEAVLGACGALAVLLLWRAHLRQSGAAWAGMGLLVAAFILSELTPGRESRYAGFNWIPLAGQMRSLAGLQNILEFVWPFFAIACLARSLCPRGRRRQLAIAGGAATALGVLALEWAQQSIPGRYGDITQVALAFTGWATPWTFRGADYDEERPAPSATAA